MTEPLCTVLSDHSSLQFKVWMVVLEQKAFIHSLMLRAEGWALQKEREREREGGLIGSD